MIKTKKIVIFIIFIFLNGYLLAEEIIIKVKVENEIITNIDVKNEVKYLTSILVIISFSTFTIILLFKFP